MDPAAITLRPLRPGDAGWIVMRHAEAYALSDGFDASFEALVARILADFLTERDTRTDRAWIAEGPAGRRLGCIFCVRLDAETAKLRLFWVEPEARGTGLGRRLLETCLGHARDTGFRRLTLWTHESHAQACKLYAKSGFTRTASEPKVNFGQPVVEQRWEIALAPEAG